VLGGGNALLAHGVISRPTADVDLFTDQEHGAQAAADAVQAALLSAGFEPARRGQAGELSDVFPDIGEGLAEWIVTAAGGEQMLLQLGLLRPRPSAGGDDGYRPGPGPGRRGGREGVRAGPPGSSRGTTRTWPPEGPLQPCSADRFCPAAGSGSDPRGFRLCRGDAGPDGRPGVR
jgi:hypothetical protein